MAEPDARVIRLGFLSNSALTKVEEISDLPEGLSPAQVDDKGGTIDRMGRPALKARIRKYGAKVDIVSVHLKSKLHSYHGGRFSSRDEGERARYSVYALHCRAAEASAVRAGVVELLDGDGRENRVILAGDLNDEPRLPRRRFCSALVARSSARPASIGPTRAMLFECGTWIG